MNLRSSILRGLGRGVGRYPGYVFGGVFALASVIAAMAVLRASTAPVEGEAIGSLRSVAALLWINLALIFGLAGMVIWRVWKVLASRSTDAGAALHLRYMTLFAAAAAVPAIVVALFFGVLVNQGVENWFSDRINTMAESSTEVSRMLVATQTERLSQDIGPTAIDINEYIAELTTSPERFDRVLELQAEGRGFGAIYVMDRTGKVLARTERPGAPAYLAPKPDAFATADRDEAGFDLSRNEDLVRILFRLSSANGLYVWIVAPMPTGMLDRLYASQEVLALYREASANRARVKAVFMASYIETALLVLIGSVWLGMASASSIAVPVARLVRAADQIAAGDFTAHLDAREDPEEIRNLSESFNRMAGDLQRQQEALRAAGADAETRRQFIETVLSGVSAGVIGLDANGRISVFNQQAAFLLELDEHKAWGEALSDVAPEFMDVALQAASSGDAEAEVDLLRGAETRRLRVRAGGNAADGLVFTFDDITRLVAAQRSAAWRDVARRIAHEIKNPLTPIQLSAERLRRKYRSEITSDLETFDRCTDTIIRQVGDIGRMVDEFSAFARMPAPKFSACDPAELLRQAVFARRVAHPDIAMEIETDDADLSVICDERMIGQALTNVLKNAAESVEARRHVSPEPPGRIVARLKKEDDGRLVYEVEDNGVGLPARDRERLTEPYVTTREKGTGLGLAIVKRILEDHGGALALQDGAGGQGALVCMTLPCSQAVVSPQPLAAEAS